MRDAVTSVSFSRVRLVIAAVMVRESNLGNSDTGAGWPASSAPRQVPMRVETRSEERVFGELGEAK